MFWGLGGKMLFAGLWSALNVCVVQAAGASTGQYHIIDVNPSTIVPPHHGTIACGSKNCVVKPCMCSRPPVHLVAVRRPGKVEC